MIRIKRKNPHLKDIEEYIRNNSKYFKFLSQGGEAKVYFFKTLKSLIINTEILKPGKYTLKIFNSNRIQDNIDGLSIQKISKYKLLSKYGLIPKIFIITKII